jgi:hypothetical protein
VVYSGARRTLFDGVAVFPELPPWSYLHHTGQAF